MNRRLTTPPAAAPVESLSVVTRQDGQPSAGEETPSPVAVQAPAEQPAAGLPPRPTNSRYQSLDFWRGAACLMLFCFHGSFYADKTFAAGDLSTWSPGALGVRGVRILWVGVPIFFVISGYCIAASIDSLRRKPHSLGNYFFRRFRRIYPPLWIASGLAVLFCLAVSLHPELVASCKQLARLVEMPLAAWFGNLTATESWLPRVTGRSESNYLMANTWTLCYEEQFYLVTGVILWLGARRFFPACAALTVLTLVTRHTARAAGVSLEGWFFDGHWLPFACGILVYYIVNYRSGWSRSWWCGLLLAGMCYAVADRLTQSTRYQRHLDDYIFCACTFALALVAFRRWDAWFASLRVLQPVVWCGKMSYSIYLLHFPLVVALSCWLALQGYHDDQSVMFLVLPLSFVLSLPLAWVFHVLVERRFMNT